MGNREVSFQSSSVDLSPFEASRNSKFAVNEVAYQEAARTQRSHHNDQGWLSVTLAQLDATRIYYLDQRVQAHDAGLTDAAQKLRQKDPIAQINQVFESIDLHLKITVDRTTTYGEKGRI